MFRAVGFLIALWAISIFFKSTLTAFDAAATQTFHAVEAAASLSTQQINQMQNLDFQDKQ